MQEPSCKRSAGGLEGPGSQMKSQVKRTWWGWRRVAAPPAAAARWRLIIARLWVDYSPRTPKKRTWWGWKRAAALAAARWRPPGGAPALFCPTPGPAAPRAQCLAPLPPHSLLPAPTPAPSLPPAFFWDPRGCTCPLQQKVVSKLGEQQIKPCCFRRCCFRRCCF